jgi:hypothetical protein
MSTTEYELRLRAESGRWQAPPAKRLALALKVLLRAFGLRCTSCFERNFPPTKTEATHRNQKHFTKHTLSHK